MKTNFRFGRFLATCLIIPLAGCDLLDYVYETAEPTSSVELCLNQNVIDDLLDDIFGTSPKDDSTNSDPERLCISE